ncbi:quinate 5-dehydrogenase [Deinococcus multiflagellatus]|uniref:Quinate 5-dehydrogenase n=1 Tax=Deinococcus multiflagellatus TaxID=1656887 RepID=A0ABW1ZJT7_9DEIO|nr:quinate 5-dehydrogenase [Deinococcus multiflagellatus]MBZ9712618.1 quinate 5-dehydrogenase [Deinococcus multiflagellatus]
MTDPLQGWQPAPAGHKHVVSISLGNSTRNARETVTVLGQPFVIERLGTDGDAAKMAALFRALDGRVDAFGLGGADLYVIAGGKKYVFANVRKLVANARQTPVLDGSGLKNTLERDAIAQLDGLLQWRTQKVLMVSAVDRFGMAEALSEHGADVVYGDIVFGLNLDRPLRSIGSLRRVAGLVLPVITKLPQDWFYPTGAKQEQSVEGKGTRYYAWADVIAGDTHYAKRYAPQNLQGKTILTQTITAADREWMKARGVRRLITTTPRMGQRNFATNVLEAMFVALSGGREALSGPQYLDYIRQVGFKPEINDLD